ncbi:MAG: histidine phosphatase family protein [Gammaproteobacteria bacterium]|nr:histidine phosphatase family protein [Gammaproteobacteria bacterium]
MAAIYLIRHGQASTDSEVYDKLSDKGMIQAKIMAKYLAEKVPHPDLVLAGTMLRHRETAQHCLSQFEVPDLYDQLYCDEGWNEYAHQEILGAYRPDFATPSGIKQYLTLNNCSLANFKTHYVAAMNRWISGTHNDDYPETWLQFKQRVLNSFLLVTKQHSNKDIFVYTSAGPISIIACYLLSLPAEQLMTINWTLVNAGITKVIIGKDQRLSLSTLNEHHYFESLDQRYLLTYT